jgi:hypothetical protein
MNKDVPLYVPATGLDMLKRAIADLLRIYEATGPERVAVLMPVRDAAGTLIEVNIRVTPPPRGADSAQTPRD